MRRISAWLGFLLCAVVPLSAIADAAQTRRVIFLSTQLRPIEEAQKMRNVILNPHSPDEAATLSAPSSIMV